MQEKNYPKLIALLGLSLTFLVLADLVSIGQSLSLLMYNINLRDTNPFLQNGGGNYVNNQHGRPSMFKAYYHKPSSMGMFQSINKDVPTVRANDSGPNDVHFRSRPGWDAPPPPKPKKIYLAS